MFNQRVPNAESLAAISIPPQVFAVYGTTPALIQNPGNRNVLIMMADKGGFNVRGGRSGIATTYTVASTTDDTLTITGHGMKTGFGPYKVETTGAAPTGLSTSVQYFVIVVDANTIKLAVSRDKAGRGEAVDITAAGSGTQTLVDGTVNAMPGTEFPSATDQANGFAGVRIPENGSLVLSNVSEVAVKGYAADSVLKYFWL